MEQSHPSVSEWIVDLHQSSDVPAREHAAQRLYERYFDRLAALALHRLNGTPRAVADEEDVALNALNSAFCGIRQGRFPRLSDRNDLWRVLLTLVNRKAVDQHRWTGAQRRGGGNVLDEQALNAPDDSSPNAIAAAQGREPTPDEAAEVMEEMERLLSMLSEELREIALWKLEGDTNKQIAERLEVVERTVERRLEEIRAIWLEDFEDG